MKYEYRKMTKAEWKALWRQIRFAHHQTSILTEGGMAARWDVVTRFRNLTYEWSLPLWDRFHPPIPRHWKNVRGEVVRGKGIWATNTLQQWLKAN